GKTGKTPTEVLRRGAARRDGRPLRDRRAVHLAPEALVIVERLVNADAVVPEYERAGLPTQAALEGGLRDVLDEKLQQRVGLGGREAFDRDRIRAVDVERELARHRMRPHERMHVAAHARDDRRRQFGEL